MGSQNHKKRRTKLVRMNEELFELLRNIAGQRDLTVSKLLDEVIEEYFSTRSKESTSYTDRLAARIDKLFLIINTEYPAQTH